MLTRSELKRYSSLLRKKYRTEEKKFLVEGKKSVSEGLDSIFICEAVFVTKQFHESNIQLARSIEKRRIGYEILKNNDFKKLTDTKSPQGIVAVFLKPDSQPKLPAESKIIVALENVSDPGNLGTIIRTCDWFGVSDLILSDDCADIYNPKVIRSAMGSLFHMNSIFENDFYSLLDKFKAEGYKIVAADLSGENVYEYKAAEKTVLVFANESHGPSDKIYSMIDGKITIPQIGKAESLNVASAVAVILSEVTRDA